MSRTLTVARREFMATVLTKGFLVGVVIFPLLMLGVMLIAPFLIDEKPPRVNGTVAVMDATGGGVAARLAASLRPDALEARLREQARRTTDEAAEAMSGFIGETADRETLGSVAARVVGDVPEVAVEELAAGADLEGEKRRLLEGSAQTGGRLAIVVVHPNALRPAEGETAFGSFDLYLRPKLDDRVANNVIRSAAAAALIDARIEAHGYNPAFVRELTQIGPITSRTVTEGGDQATNEAARFLIPAGFMLLLWISAFTGGQYLLTTTIEEKSNRIMEVLLSAVSPLQLMTGKILGQMAVGLLILFIYTGLGIGGLLTFSLAYLLSPANIGYLIVFFFIAYFMIAAMMAAVGSAVNDVHEAQSLITPIVLVMVVPLILWLPITRDPNSALATVMSFIPGVNPFVMVLRLASATEPIPLWQVALSIAVGLATVVFAAWAAAKIFRIGVLLYGKPPNVATLIRWIRMA